MADASSLDDLASALQTLAEALASASLDARRAGDGSRADALDRAKAQIGQAAEDVNNESAAQRLSGAAFDKLDALATSVSNQADQIARQEQNVQRIANIVSGLVRVGTSIASGNFAGVIGAVDSVSPLLR